MRLIASILIKAHILLTEEKKSLGTEKNIDGMIKAFSFFLLYNAFPSWTQVFLGRELKHETMTDCKTHYKCFIEETILYKMKISSNIKSIAEKYKSIGTFLSFIHSHYVDI